MIALLLALFLQTDFVSMDSVIVNYPNYSGVAYEYQTNLTNGQIGPWVVYPMIPGLKIGVGIELSGTNAGKVEYTLAKYESLTNVTNGYIWPAGIARVSTNDVLIAPVTAFRFVSVIGAVRGYARGQEF